MTKKNRPTKTAQGTHSQEFRETAIKLAIAGDKSIANVARDLGIPEWKLYGWVQSYRKQQPKQNGKEDSSGADLRKLQKRVRELEQENEILKKASA
jgi:transposase